MSYLFFLVVGLFWGLLCGFCDARGLLGGRSPMTQLFCGLLGYGIAALFFWGQPEGGNWFMQLLVVVTVGQLSHSFWRARFRPKPANS